MMKNFIKQSDTTFVRIIKSLLIGGFIGGHTWFRRSSFYHIWSR